MFNDVLIIPESRARVMFWALPFSFGVHALLAAALIILPLLRPGSPPRLDLMGAFFAPAATVPSVLDSFGTKGEVAGRERIPILPSLFPAC